MSKLKSKDNVNSLLAAIQRTPTAAPEPPSVAIAGPAPPRKASQRTAEAPATSRVGKAVTFWLHDEDRKLIRELAAWLAGQGLRPTDSMVIRSALRMAKTGADLLEAYREAAQLDGRLKQRNGGETV